MTCTNIDLDDALVAEVMSRHQLTTKKDAVDFALRRLVGAPITSDLAHSLEGIGWDGDLGEIRAGDNVAP